MSQDSFFQNFLSLLLSILSYNLFPITTLIVIYSNLIMIIFKYNIHYKYKAVNYNNVILVHPIFERKKDCKIVFPSSTIAITGLFSIASHIVKVFLNLRQQQFLLLIYYYLILVQLLSQYRNNVNLVCNKIIAYCRMINL